MAKPFFFWLNFSNSSYWLTLGKTYISSWNFFSWQNLYFLLAKIFSLVKAYIFSWQNFSLLAKSIFLFG
jgi:hypothetical protein